FQLNRVYLVSAALLSFLIPLIQSNWVKNLFVTQEIQHTIYNSPVINSPIVVGNLNLMPAQSTLTVGEIVNAIYIAVTLFLIIRLMWQLVILKKAIEKPSPSAAYSFFRKISLGDKLEHADVIARHERVHAGQWHSVDVMIIETVMIINWFNPVVYLYRFAIKYIHEFIADRQVIKSGTDKVDYALLLLSQTFEVPTHTLVNTFYNHTLLKQRIAMLQKNKSQRIALAKYGLSAPLFILMLILSSATVNNSKVIKAINRQTENVLSASADDLAASIVDHAEIPNESLPPETDPYVDSYNKLTQLKIDTAAFADRQPVASVEHAPQFPGSLVDFLLNNIRYPAAMRQANIEGKVDVQFVVETNGAITNIKAINAPGYGSGEEAERVMASSPKWTPAYQNGKPIKVMYTVPINFTLNNSRGTAANNMIFSIVEKQPEFPGGLEKFGEFLQRNIRYPDNMRQANVQGKAIVQFVVEADGSLSNIQVLRSPGYGSGEEAARVLALSPKWTPGHQNGKAVRVMYTVPVSFTLGNGMPVQGAVADTGVRKTSTATYKTDMISFSDIKSLSEVRNALKLNDLDNPVFIIDGVKKDRAAFDNIDVNKIKTVVVFTKGSTTNSGVDTSNGVVFITTKSAELKKLQGWRVGPDGKVTQNNQIVKAQIIKNLQDSKRDSTKE
ncbi:MAG TPA: TonB family protein, partial [Mucilaginibacter sp.]|nr:TonB family protein [Mucilaginibacter sp.]